LDRDRSRRTAIAVYLFTRALQYGTVWLFERFATWYHAAGDDNRRRLMQRAHSVDVVTTVDKLRDHVHISPPSPTEAAKPAHKRGLKQPGAVGGLRPASSGFGARAIHYTRKYASTALMACSDAVITYMLAFNIDCLAPSFRGLVLKASGLDSLCPRKARSMFTAVTHGVEHTGLQGRIPDGVPTREFMASFPQAGDVLGILDDRIHHDYVACGMFHSHTTSCTHGLLSAALRSFPYAMRLHIPFNTAVLVLFKHKQLRKDPVRAITELIRSTTQSSIFYSMMVTGNVNAPCILRKITGRDIPLNYVISGALGGMAVLIDRPGRRTELSMYCFLRALEALWALGVKRGVWRNIRHGEVALFSFAMAVLMAIYQNDPTTLNLTYHSTLTRIFGKN
ncbi:hypothetical protein IWQ57_002883, partial [Coemansia nantahalensis]